MNRRTFLALSTMSATTAQSPDRQPARSHARSMVITRRGVVAAEHVFASQAAAQLLARGGSAMDAAIAANAVIGVIQPNMCGIGGDLFVLFREGQTGKVGGLNAGGWAPKGLSIDFLTAKGIRAMPANGIHTATVPGCVRGWQQLHKRYGKLPWRDLFQPAIYYAREGFPISELVAAQWEYHSPALSLDETSKKLFTVGGELPKVGDVFRNPLLAKALEVIATGGADAYYKGPIASAIVARGKSLGSAMDLSDLAEFEAEWIEPLSTTYRGWTVHEVPPNGTGIAALQMLNMMERFPIGEWSPLSPEALHIKMESQKLAFADLYRYLADPRFVKVPSVELNSKDYAAARAKLIDVTKARCEAEPGNPLGSTGDTSYMAVADRDGNVVSLIQSVAMGFGSGVVVPEYGFHLHNRGMYFQTDKSHPNALAPRKRPFHTIIPAVMEKGSTHLAFGIMGGPNQPQAHAQFVSNIVDHGMNIQAALEAPRFTRATPTPCEFLIEDRVPVQTREALAAKGHVLKVVGAYSGAMGGGQAAMHDSKSKLNYGASSPRKDGAAIPEPDPWG